MQPQAFLHTACFLPHPQAGEPSQELQDFAWSAGRQHSAAAAVASSLCVELRRHGSWPRAQQTFPKDAETSGAISLSHPRPHPIPS